MPWLALLPLVAVAATDPAPPPGLNHVYVVLDQPTFDAVRQSAVVANVLGPGDGGLPAYAPPAPDADRIFFRGRQTYLELFAPKNRFDEPVGKVGIGIGVDDRAGFDALADRWQRLCGADTDRSTTLYRRATPPVPWYDSVQCNATALRPDMAVWAMVYRPDFYRWQANAPTAPARITRRDILAPRHGQFDVTGLSIDVTGELFDRLVPQLTDAGLARDDIDGRTRLRGDGWSITLRRVAQAPGLAALTLATPGASRDVPLGNARWRQTAAGTVEVRFRR